MEPPQYTLDERDRRWDLTRAFMAANELDALIVHGEHEDAGPAPVTYDTWFTNGRPGATVVFPASGDPWVAPGSLRASRTSSALSEAVSELCLSAARVGTVGLGAHMPWNPEGIMPYGTWSAVLERFPSADFQAETSRTEPLLGQAAPRGGASPLTTATHHTRRTGADHTSGEHRHA